MFAFLLPKIVIEVAYMKCGRLGCEARTEEVVTSRVRSLHRDLGRLCAGRESREYHYKGSRQQ